MEYGVHDREPGSGSRSSMRWVVWGPLGNVCYTYSRSMARKIARLLDETEV